MLRLDWNLLFTVINLVILYLLMQHFLFKPIKKIMAERQAKIDGDFASAAETQKKADELKTQYEDSLDKIQDERVKVLQDTRNKADKEYSKIIGDANTKAQKIKDDAVLEGENMKKQILNKAEKEIADMVVNATVKVVGNNDQTDDATLYNKFLDKAGDK